jgi:hypothetical protein
MKLIQEMTQEEASGIRFILMDNGDTLTKNEKVLAVSYISAVCDGLTARIRALCSKD